MPPFHEIAAEVPSARAGCAGRLVVALLSALLACGAAVAETPTPPAAAASAAPPEAAAARPRIGLVLSGGGARGAAHIGVLKVLEELHVPIDAIAGTSMGAVVGGLYASGLSPREIEATMTSLSWQDAFLDRPPRADLGFRRKQEDENFLVKLPLGLRGGRFQLPRGLIQGQKLTQTLRRLTLPVAPVQDFDALPTRFRAVATDLESGDRIVLKSGDLPTAMRASLSAPGVFVPVESEGRVLVDGGLADNLPVDVAREMGVDVLVVVDVGAPLVGRKQLDTVPVISNQMLAILIRREAQRQRASLGPGDVVIEPPLGDASSYDFSDIRRGVSIGERGARAMAAALQRLASPPADYQRYVAARAAARTGPAPRIDFVRVRPDSERYGDTLRDVFGELAGEPLQPERMARRINNMFGRGNFETLDYRVVRDGDQYGIEFAARRNSWGPNYVRFGLNLQDDFEGDSVYNAAARITMTEITRAGGEWVWDLQVGQSPRIATEMWLPLGPTSPYFVMPFARFDLRNLPIIQNGARVAEYRVRTTSYGMEFGRELRSWGELRFGYRREFGTQRVRIGDPDLPRTRFAADQYYVRFAVDSLDDLNFPRHGQQLSVEWLQDSSRLLEQQRTERVTADYLAAGSSGRNTAVFWLSAGSTVSGTVVEPRSLFPLGGLFRLSGVAPDAVSGPHFGIARVLLYRQIGAGGGGRFLDVPTYAGVSLEIGDAVAKRGDFSFGDARRDASLFLGLDTLLGPVYLAVGHEDGGRTAFYLFLGRTF